MAVNVTLNGLVFSIPTKGQRDWGTLTDWILEVNETLVNSSDTFIIPAGSANLVNGSAVNLYTVDSPTTNAHIIFEYGINRETTGGSAESRSETGTVLLTYNAVDGSWAWSNTSVCTGTGGGDLQDSKVVISVSGANVIQATASALAGSTSGGTSNIVYRGRIIRV